MEEHRRQQQSGFSAASSSGHYGGPPVAAAPAAPGVAGEEGSIAVRPAEPTAPQDPWQGKFPTSNPPYVVTEAPAVCPPKPSVALKRILERVKPGYENKRPEEQILLFEEEAHVIATDEETLDHLFGKLDGDFEALALKCRQAGGAALQNCLFFQSWWMNFKSQVCQASDDIVELVKQEDRKIIDLKALDADEERM